MLLMDFATEAARLLEDRHCTMQLLDLRGISQVATSSSSARHGDRQMRSVADEITELGRDMGTTRFRTNSIRHRRGSSSISWMSSSTCSNQSSSLLRPRGSLVRCSPRRLRLRWVGSATIQVEVPHADEMAVDVPDASCPHD